MIANAETQAEPTDALPIEAQVDDVFYRDVLIDITDAAREFAKLLLSTAQRAHDPADILRLAAAFERTSRCARRGILIARHIRKPLKLAEPTRPARARDASSPAKTPPNPVPELQAETPAEAQHREFRDRLDALDPVLNPALAQADLPDAVVALQRDLRRVFEELSKPLYKPKRPPIPIPKPDD